MPFISKWASCELGRSCSFSFHTYGCCLSCWLNLLGNSVFSVWERFHSDGCFLKCPRGACWSSFKSLALHNRSKSTQMAPRAVPWIRRWWFTLQACIYIPEGDAILTCSDGFNVERLFWWIIHGVCGGIGYEQGEILKLRKVSFYGLKTSHYMKLLLDGVDLVLMI